MKTRKKLLLALLSATCVTAGAFGLAACGSKPSANDTRDPDIVAVYTAYVASAEANNETVLTYEQWLETVKGAAGTDGVDGATWLSGAADPVATAGKVGDFYLNTATFDVFKKGTDGWGTSICNLKGADGTASKGEDGATWLSGEDAPAATAGKEGDFYLDTKTSDVYKKTAEGWGTPICNLTGATGATGATGGTGAAGAAGVGIADIRLVGKRLIIEYTGLLDPEDPASNKTTILLPESLFHTHTYESSSAGYYDEVIIPATEEQTGLGYKICTGTVDDKNCGHVEVVVIPKLTHSGTENDPVWIHKEFTETESNVYRSTITEGETLYYEFVPEADGYFYVTTFWTIDDNGYLDTNACNFTVTNGAVIYNQDDTSSVFTAPRCEVKAGQKVTIQGRWRNSSVVFEEAQRYIEFTYYAKGSTQEYAVTVTDSAGAPVANASVKAFTYDGTAFTEVAGVSGTTDASGVAILNLPVNDYYFSVTPSNPEAYSSVKEGESGPHIGLRPDLATTVELEAAGGGSETINSPNNEEGAMLSFKANTEYTYVVTAGDTLDYAIFVSDAYFDYVEVDYGGYQYVLIQNGEVQDEDFIVMFGLGVENGKVVSIPGLDGTKFKVSADCTGMIFPDFGEEEGY